MEFIGNHFREGRPEDRDGGGEHDPGPVELPQPLDHVARVPRAAVDRLQVGRGLLPVVQNAGHAQEQFAEAQDGRERVVEVVRNAAGHLAQGAQAFLLDDLGLCRLEFDQGAL